MIGGATEPRSTTDFPLGAQGLQGRAFLAEKQAARNPISESESCCGGKDGSEEPSWIRDP